MSIAEKTVFISYRRSTSKHLARLIFEHLRKHGYDVFLDVSTIDNGAFDHIILNQIAARVHFILLLTPGTLERCNDPNDWLRQEVETAIRLKRNIVPVIDEDFSLEKEAKQLPESMQGVLRLNGLPLYSYYFEAAIDALISRFLKEPLYNISLTEISSTESAIVKQRIQEALNDKELDVDTVVVPAREAAVDRTFLNENRWYAVRIHETMRPLIKYCALYQVAPHSAITHIAPVASIEPWPDEPGKVVINFSDKPQAIDPIKLVKKGRIKPLYNLRYTTHQKIKSAKTLDDIW